MINIQKVVSRFSQSALSLLRRLDEQFYVDNYLKSAESTQLQTASFTINKKSVTLLGVPRQGDQALIVDDLAASIFKDPKLSSFMVQFDPTPYLHARRQLYKQIHKKAEVGSSLAAFDSLPILPLDVNETLARMEVFDCAHVLQSKNPDPAKIMQILEGTQLGYFSSHFERIRAVQEAKQGLTRDQEKEGEALCQEFSDILLKTAIYQDNRYMQEFARLSLFQALYMIALKGGSVYLTDLSLIYQRIHCGIFLTLTEAQDMFKDICAEFLDGSQMYPKQFFDFQTMLWKQQGIEYYLLYSLNAFLAEEQDEAVTMLVDMVHFDPLRVTLAEQKGKLITEINRSFFNEFSFPKREAQESDEQLLEKHAILDAIMQQNLWGEKLLKNPFPYLLKDYTKMVPQEQKEVQQLYFKYAQKYDSVMKEVMAKNNLK